MQRLASLGRGIASNTARVHRGNTCSLIVRILNLAERCPKIFRVLGQHKISILFDHGRISRLELGGMMVIGGNTILTNLAKYHCRLRMIIQLFLHGLDVFKVCPAILSLLIHFPVLENGTHLLLMQVIVLLLAL